MGMNRQFSNYDKMKDEMSEVFLRYDQHSMIQKFALEHDENNLYLLFLNRKYRVNRFTGRVTWSKDSFQTVEDADYNEVMTIYDVLCYSKENCCLAHEWVNTGSLSTVQGGTLVKGGDFFHRSGEYFSGKADLLARACEVLVGRKAEGGDLAYELDLFPFLPIILRFWDADEDFPASLQVFVDQNILDYMHYETLMFAIGHLLNRLKEEMRSGVCGGI